MSDLTDFLLARIAEDEQDCRDHQNWREWCPECGSNATRLRAECEAKRRIMSLHVDSQTARGVGRAPHGTPWTPYCEQDSEDWPCEEIRILAAVYADHPDYREEWRP